MIRGVRLTCCDLCRHRRLHVLPFHHCSSQLSHGCHKAESHPAPCMRQLRPSCPEKLYIIDVTFVKLKNFEREPQEHGLPLTSISMKAKPGGLRATQTSRTRPILEKASSRSNLVECYDNIIQNVGTQVYSGISNSGFL